MSVLRHFKARRGVLIFVGFSLLITPFVPIVMDLVSRPREPKTIFTDKSPDGRYGVRVSADPSGQKYFFTVTDASFAPLAGSIASVSPHVSITAFSARWSKDKVRILGIGPVDTYGLAAAKIIDGRQHWSEDVPDVDEALMQRATEALRRMQMQNATQPAPAADE